MEVLFWDNLWFVLVWVVVKRFVFCVGFWYVSGNCIIMKFLLCCYIVWLCRCFLVLILCFFLLFFFLVCVCVFVFFVVCNLLVYRFVYNVFKGFCEDLEDSVSGFFVFLFGVVVLWFCILYVYSFWWVCEFW